MSSRVLSIACALLVLAIFTMPAVSAQTEGSSDRVITTQANSEVMVAPDRAQITLSVQTQNADVKLAQSENARIMDGMVNAVLGIGIDRADLKTSGYSIYPVYEDSSLPFGQRIKYYQVTNSIRITSRDVTRVGEIIDAGVNNGANQVDSIAFMVSEELEQSVRTQVLTKAVQKARSDADIIATASGVSITGVKEIVLGSYYPPIIYERSGAYGMDGKTQAAVPTTIEAGEISITAQVSATYLIS